MDLDPELALALRLADVADAITRPAFEGRAFALDWKANATEVTEVDRGTEAAIADVLATERPDHGRYGEEHGRAGDPDSPWCWVVDPIDGTSGFVRGIPVWATLIALTHAEHGVVVGVVSAPALGRRWWAARGGGTFVNGRPCAVSDVAVLGEAQVSLTPNDGWDELGLTAALSRLGQDARRVRGFGDFWQHCLVAEGALDVAVDAVGVAPYDLAAVRVIVEEAGGRFTDRHGEPTHEHDTAVSSNGRLHDEVLRRLAAPDPLAAAAADDGIAVETTIDRAEVLALYDAVGWTAYTAAPDDLLAGLARSTVLCARDDGELVGLARVVSDGHTIAYLQDLIVRPDRQRRGIGRRLVADAVRRFGHCRQFFLTTGLDDPARDFYEAVGLVAHEAQGMVAYGLPEDRPRP